MAFPIAPILVKYGAVALVSFVAQRAVRARIAKGRTDQRGEDALDNLPEGLTAHTPRDRAQKNGSARFTRRITLRGTTYERDAGVLARWRITKV